MGLSGEEPLGEGKTDAPDSDYYKIKLKAGRGRAGLPQARGEDR